MLLFLRNTVTNYGLQHLDEVKRKLSDEQTPLDAVDISHHLRMIMAQRKLTVTDMASLAGVSKSAMEKYLAGPSSPRATAIASLAQALGIKADFILFGEFDLDRNVILNEAQKAFFELIEALKVDASLYASFVGLDRSSKAWRDFIWGLSYQKAVELAGSVVAEAENVRTSGVTATYL